MRRRPPARPDEGNITFRVAGTYPTIHAAEAHRRLEAGGVRVWRRPSTDWTETIR
jgi:hypothetical protein